MDDMENNRKKKNTARYDVEKIVIYAVALILLVIVICLGINNHRLKDKLNSIEKGETVPTGAPAGDDGVTEADNATSQDSAEAGSTEAAAPLMVVGDVKYKDIEVPETEKTDNYNGDDLEDNGYPYAIKINRQENIVTIYTLDAAGYYTVPVKAMRCSVSPIGETPTGLFNIQLKWDWLALFDDCYGQYVSQIDGDTLFHSVPYLDTTKDSLETWEFNKLGTGASLGCVRLCVADTKWIYENCEAGTYVDIFDSDYYGPLGRPVPVTKLENTDEQGWDPTDMVEENPTTGKAVIYGAESHSIDLGENYDTMAGIWAFNSSREDVTDQLKVEGTVDNSKTGQYNITYSFMDGGKEISKSITITVKDGEAPVITRIPEELTVENYSGQGEELAQIVASYISAQDGDTIIKTAVATDGNGHRLDGTDVSKLEENVICVAVNNVKEEAGTYTVVCCARDSGGNRSEYHTVNVKIVK